jgi:hypothetical protein
MLYFFLPLYRQYTLIRKLFVLIGVLQFWTQKKVVCGSDRYMSSVPLLRIYWTGNLLLHVNWHYFQVFLLTTNMNAGYEYVSVSGCV